MAPFESPEVVASGIKEKIDSLLAQADRLYLGSSTGSLHIYTAKHNQPEDETAAHEASFQLEEIKKGVARRSIEQLGFLKDVNSLVVLSEMNINLLPLPSLSPPTPLTQAKAAFSFAIHSSVQDIQEATSSVTAELDQPKPKPIPTLVTRLLVGCRRKAVLYTWKDGEAQEAKEAPLPHSARSIAFLNPDSACFAYSPTEYAIFNLSTMTAVDIVTPLPTTTSVGVGAMGALSGLTGYMTLGLAAKPKPIAVKTAESEVLITKDTEGFFIGPDAKTARTTTLEWPAPPEDLSVLKPYIFSVLPAGTVAVAQQDPPPTAKGSTQPSEPSLYTTSVLQIRSSLSLGVAQTIPFPFSSSPLSPTVPIGTTLPPVPNSTLRLLTPSPTKPHLFLLSTPTDKAAAAAEGSSIWQFTMKPWADQIDELVLAGQYSDALDLLGSIDETALPDKVQRRTRIRALNAVSQFRAGRFDEAIDTFIELDFNPAKVVALYPEAVSGRLAVPQDRWIPLYGGPTVDDDTHSIAPSTAGSEEKDKDAEKTVLESGIGKSAADLLDSVAGPSLKNRFQKFIDRGQVPKDDDSASIISARRKTGLHGDLNRSIETLVRFLTDRRPKLGKSLEAMKITPQNQDQKYPPLSKTSVEDLFALPDAPLASLTPEQLLRFAQIVDTALYKAYLIIRPTLLSSLCRVPNWCEVSELEEDLRSRKKYSELKDLYHGKGAHAKALELLKKIAEDETDLEDKLDPSIRYLQKLGPEHLPQIFESAKWIFDADKDMAFQIFLSEDVELPAHPVADYLEKIDPRLCIRYLEHLLEEKEESASDFHDRLAGLYLSQTLAAKKRGDEELRREMYSKLLTFLDSNDRYGIDRLYGQLSTTDLFEARAILLGRLGRHDQALELYVYRLQDYRKAEEYCKRIYQPGSATSSVFLTLLRIYLRPTSNAVDASTLLRPALDLISRHGPRLDSVETLKLLPPLVTTHDLKEFLVDAVRAPIFDARVTRGISKARNDQVARRLVALQARRVKVTDTRICPQCHKRIGNSVIAVHSPQ
ncbi:hypothetical protein D9611_001421 [Ephemerocybe angulata]|uniref:CNH domain-containing protein n=1 Tax=Ephemerocybe angulata TaxID=980116 RepID=A0A8H5CIG5_9AGAR|nr:hypothetical protein D9611_001421 [Tulosesus angulatus]